MIYAAIAGWILVAYPIALVVGIVMAFDCDVKRPIVGVFTVVTLLALFFMGALSVLGFAYGWKV